MLEKKNEADATIQLMKLTYARVVAEEETKRGLIITAGKYGLFSSRQEAGSSSNDEIIDVTIPLQCLVKDSKLILHENSKVCETLLLLLLCFILSRLF